MSTRRAVIDKLTAALIDAARDPAYRTTMDIMQTQVGLLSGEAYAAALGAESAYFDRIIAGMRKR